MRYLGLAMLLCLGGCGVLQSEAQRGVSYGYDRTPPMTFTTADVRVITDRPSATTGHRIMCTEPAPDVAKAVSGNILFGASGGNGAATGKLDASGASAEAVAELAGRSTALMGLRDGLYRACEAYANGAIGQDMYALIISRYSQLMSTLFLGQDMTGALVRPGAGTAGPPPAQPAGSADTAPPAAAPVARTRSAEASAPIVEAVASDAPPLLLGPLEAAAAGQPATPAPKGDQPASTAPDGVVARALTRMNEDFIDLSAAHIIVVACINNGDQTRDRPVGIDADGVPRAHSNPLLDRECPSLLTAILSREPLPARASASVDPDLGAAGTRR